VLGFTPTLGQVRVATVKINSKNIYFCWSLSYNYIKTIVAFNLLPLKHGVPSLPCESLPWLLPLWGLTLETTPSLSIILHKNIDHCWVVFSFLVKTFKVFNLVLKMTISDFHIK
jgi:hypothetical protein